VTVRPRRMGRPLVWAWVVVACFGAPAPCPAQVAPLSVTLHAEAPCPAPAAESPLLRLPTGCPTPWAGWLYTPDEHTRIRSMVAQLDAAALAERARADAEGERADATEKMLGACRAQRAELDRACVVGVSRIEGQVRALADISEPPPRPVLWPWAALSGGLAAAGAGAGALAGRGAGEVLGYGLAGLAVGTAVALMVERWGR